MLALFVIRQTGLKEEIINDLFNEIKNTGEFEISEKRLITLDEQKIFYRLFYDQITEDTIQNTINKISGKKLFVIVAKDNAPVKNDPKYHTVNKNVWTIKRKIRNKYGNVIHCADTPENAQRELDLLFNINEISETINKIEVFNKI